MGRGGARLGLLGKTADNDGKLKKTWFTSVRFRGSRYAYREVLWRTDLRTVIAAIQNAFKYFGAVPLVLVIDNSTAAVAKARSIDDSNTLSMCRSSRSTTSVSSIWPSANRRTFTRSSAGGTSVGRVSSLRTGKWVNGFHSSRIRFSP